MAEQVLVLGVGNILFSDEAIGVRTVEHLQQCASLPGNVELMDGGTLGIRLMDAIMGCDLLIVVDAVLGGGEPGTLYRLEGEGLRESMSFRDSMHQTDLVDTLIYCDLAGHRPDAVVIGMEPADYHTMEIGLTPVCQARLPNWPGRSSRSCAHAGLSRSVRLEKRLGKGGETFLEKGFPSPSPSPIPPFPKTFDFIESLFAVFPARMTLEWCAFQRECLQAAFGGAMRERESHHP